MSKILLVEDDVTIVTKLSEFLSSEGFEVLHTDGQRGAIELLGENVFDIALLDVTLADGNGFALCAKIKADYDMPVVFLTASDDEYSTVTGLDIGADDYIAKPFRPRELLSRIRSVLRRAGKSASVIVIENVKIDTEKGIVEKCGRELNLSALEYRLLLVFLNNRGKVLTRTRLLEDIWDVAGDFVNDNTLTVYIKRLRDKLEDDGQNPTIIKTVRGLGYRID